MDLGATDPGAAQGSTLAEKLQGLMLMEQFTNEEWVGEANESVWLIEQNDNYISLDMYATRSYEWLLPLLGFFTSLSQSNNLRSPPGSWEVTLMERVLEELQALVLKYQL